MLTETTDYDALYRDFRWDIPARFNMATACCDRHADGTGRLALIYLDEDGGAQRTSFDDISEMSRRFANVLKADGLVRGDRVAVFLSQSLELPIAHLAAFRAGAGVDPAVCAVRRGRAGISAVEFRRKGHRHRRDRLGEARRKSATGCRISRTSMSSASARLPAPNRSGRSLKAASAGICDRRYRGRRSRDDHLHLGHHG